MTKSWEKQRVEQIKASTTAFVPGPPKCDSAAAALHPAHALGEPRGGKAKWQRAPGDAACLEVRTKTGQLLLLCIDDIKPVPLTVVLECRSLELRTHPQNYTA